MATGLCSHLSQFLLAEGAQMESGFCESGVAQRAIYLRGLFVHRHSGIEYAINELLVRARLLEEYQAIGDLPFKLESRLRLLERMMAMTGRLSEHARTFSDAATTYREYTQHRHCMVHGLMHLPTRDDPNQTIRFRSYTHRSGRLHRGRLDLSIEELSELVDRIFDISGKIVPLVAQIINQVPLPDVMEDEADQS